MKELEICCTQNNLKVTGILYYNGDYGKSKVLIKEGSEIISNPVTHDETREYIKDYKQKIMKARKELKRDGYIDEKKFLKDKEFKTLNEAGEIILGRTNTIYKSFGIMKNGQVTSLDQLRKQQVNNSSINDDLKLTEELEQYLHLNTIFYGVPGCGKSYYVKNLLKYNNGTSIDDKYYKRILFHPEYTYSDFVGQIMPESEGNSIRYNFQAGPFIEILKDALTDSDGQYFLIIEEINRGNAPAIFGDIFQLLDRKDGVSEYKIYNKQVIDWLRKNGVEDVSQLYIPANLTIFATMNTSDQNVFIMDTAFKRRWRMHRIVNNFEDDNNPILKQTITLNNQKQILWKDFAKALNKDIVMNCNDGMVVEDKLLGTNFIKLNELSDIQQFAEKILMYLWNDVVKYNKEQLFNQVYKILDDVIKDFVAGKNVFNDNCENLKKLYDAENNSVNGNNYEQ